jgi:hypothetical protein
MKSIRLGINLLAVCLVCLICSSLAQAQATRTWVSGVGDDANPCSRTAPCKTFAGAISKTAPGGEISVLDPGGFGAVTITKSITLNGDGTLAGILAATVNGIIINAGVNDTIVIRSLSINGTSGANIGLNGIRFLAGKHLRVENCTIAGFTQQGIDFAITGSGTGVSLSVQNVSITTVGTGIRQSAGSGLPTSQINNLRVNSSSFGLDVVSGNATIANSALSHIANEALKAEGTTTLNAVSTVVSNSSVGLSAASNGSTVNFANCDIFNNSTGLNIVAGATGNRFGNSRIFSNSVNENVLGTLNNPANR